MNNAFVGVTGRGCRARKSVDPLTKMDEAVVDYQRQTWLPAAFLAPFSISGAHRTPESTCSGFWL